MKKGLRIILLAAVFLFAGSTCLKVQMLKAEESDAYIYEGVYLDGVNVGGLTKEEAQKLYEEYIDSEKESKIIFSCEDNSYEVTLEEIGLSVSIEDAVEEAYAYGRRGNLLKRYKEIQELETESAVVVPEKTIDEEALTKLLEEDTEDLVVGAENASLEIKNGEIVIIPEVIGKQVAVEETVESVKAYLAQEWDGGDIEITVSVEEDQPEYTAEDFALVTDVLGTYSTSYSGTVAREKNLINGSGKINGTVLMPGEEFSVYDTVSPFTLDNGYAEAAQYLDGEVISGIGGGICQVSTTLYNAVLLAELEVTERFSHSMVVGYVPKSADAAISGQYKDFKFVNSTDYPIYIVGGAGGGKISFTIYGHETRDTEHRTIQFESKILSTTEPTEEIITVDETMPVGYRKVTQSAHIGYKAELWKYVYIDGVLTESIKVNTSSYIASPARVTVGPDPAPEVPAEPVPETPAETPTEAPVPTEPSTEATTAPETPVQ